MTLRLTPFVILCLIEITCAGKAPEPVAPGAALAADDLALSVVASLKKDDFSGAVKSFGQQLSRVVTATKLQDVWRQIVEQLGPLAEYHIAERGQVQGLETRVVALRFERGQALADVAVNTAEGSIEQLFIGPPGSPGRMGRSGQ